MKKSTKIAWVVMTASLVLTAVIGINALSAVLMFFAAIFLFFRGIRAMHHAGERADYEKMKKAGGTDAQALIYNRQRWH